MGSLLTSKEAAAYLGYSEYTLRSSRSVGMLSGVPTPSYLKIGVSVRYKKEDLDSWIKGATVSNNSKQDEV